VKRQNITAWISSYRRMRISSHDSSWSLKASAIKLVYKLLQENENWEAAILCNSLRHNSINVLHLEKKHCLLPRSRCNCHRSEKAWSAGRQFHIVFSVDGQTLHQFELTWLRDRKELYNLVIMNSILLSKSTISQAPMPCMKKWLHLLWE